MLGCLPYKKSFRKPSCTCRGVDTNDAVTAVGDGRSLLALALAAQPAMATSLTGVASNGGDLRMHAEHLPSPHPPLYALWGDAMATYAFGC